ncbi:MAG TPA: hypothetical protein VLJ86_09880 [Ramlibacter sp.]|nr:hypothetical protein [Ramlibacter sp.]
MKLFIVPVLMASAMSLAMAKLPELDDAAKAKAAEAAAKTAWQGKVDAFLLCKAQDRVVAQYRKSGGAKPVAVASTDVKPVAAAPAAGNEKPTPAPAAVVAAPAACADPGPFAYNPPEQKPLEASGAHSPAGTAASPPSVITPSAGMAPAKK